jgi:peptide methionine sulfoxide reductase MsrA
MKATHIETFLLTRLVMQRQVEFDPTEVSYEDLVNVFWSIYNPTTKNKQGWEGS